MRTLTLLGTLILGLAFAGAALGESGPRGEVVSEAASGTRVSLPSATHLRLSPLFIEILAIEERARETEVFLLEELAGTADAAEAARIVRSLERLNTQKHLDILETRMVHARRTGHDDLALRLRNEIVAIMTGEPRAAR